MNAQVRNRTFTTPRGNAATVWHERAVEERNGVSGHGPTVRTWVEVAGREVEAGCSFRAERACNDANV